jgi:hypothetical protein
MSNNFLYKGVSVTNSITTGVGSTVPGYNFLGTTTNTTGLRPVKFGYSYQGIDISNYCTARNDIYKSASSAFNIPIPAGCKSIRASGIGGGGGTGGNGGYGQANNGAIKSANTAKGNGGAGGIGGFGTYLSTTANVVGQSQISITLGAPGNIGKDGANNSGTAKSGTLEQKGKDGDPGGSGTYTTIKIGNVTNSVGLPGYGGNGGIGGTAKAVYSSKTSSNKGADGTPGNATTQQSGGNFSKLNPSGDTSTGGAVQIVWLYD